MAIAQMHKIRIVTLKKHSEFLYSVLQSLQVVEPKDLATELANSDEETNVDDMDEDIQKSIDQDEDLTVTQTRLSNIQNVIVFLNRYVPAKSFKEKHSVPIPVYTLEELDDEVESFDSKKLVHELHVTRDKLVDIDAELEELDEEEDFLLLWYKLNITPQDIENFKHIGAVVGTVPQTADNEYVNKVKAYEHISQEEVLHTDDVYGFVAYFDKDDQETVMHDLRDMRFDRLHYSYDLVPTEQVKVVQERKKELKKEQADIRRKLKTRGEDLRKLELAAEYFYAKEQRQIAKHLALQTDNVFAFEGWIEKEETDRMEGFIFENIPNDEVYIEYEEIKEEEIDDVPIKLKNNVINSPFETVTEMYALPKYNEMDPTPWVTPFYMLFFGMMMGDLGYGILMWLATFFALRFLNLKAGMKKNVKFFHLLSYPTMLVGLIYGSLFGVTIPTQIIDINAQAVQVLLISMIIGIVHIILALGLNTFLNFKLGQPIAAIKDGLAWIVVLLGAVATALGALVLNNSTVLNAGLIAMGIALVVVVIGSIIDSDNKGAGLAWGLYDVYGISGYIGDIVSYSRLMALGMSGGSIAAAFNMLVGMLPVWARFTIGIVLILALQLFNMFLSLLSAYVHGLRLIFVEFFGKFYNGGGRKFAPLKAKEDYIEIKQSRKYV